MNSSRKRIIISLWVLGLFTLTMLISPSLDGYGRVIDNHPYTINGLDSYIEDFSTTTYRDGATTASGWGSGVVSIARNFTGTLLDHYATTSPVRDIVVQGRKAYCALDTSASDALQIYDINNPREIKFLDSRATISHLISIDVDGDNAYVGVDITAARMNSYDVQDPFNLNAAGVYLDTYWVDGTVTDIDIEGHLIYFTSYNDTGDRSLRLAYAEDPDAIVEIVPDWNSANAHGLAISGQLAYIAASTEGFYILNVTNKYQPIEIGFVNTPGNATEVIIDGAYAFVADGAEGVQVIDIRNPASPTIVGSINTPGFAHKLVKQGNTLFVADGSEGIFIIDVANPAHPVFVTQLNPSSYTWDVDLYGGDLVVGTNAGLHTYRVGYLGNFAVDWYDNPLSGITVYDIRVQGDIAFIAGGSDGFYTVDVRNPSNPTILDHYAADIGVVYDALDLCGQFAYVLCEIGIDTFDISNPNNIQHTRFEFGTDLEDIVLNGPIAYVAYGDPGTAGFATLNYTYAYDAGFTANVNFGTNISTIDVQGKHVYTVENNGWVWAPSPYLHYTVPDVLNPTFSGSYPTLLQLAQDTFVDGDLQYIADVGYLIFTNVSDPTSPDWFGDVWVQSSNIASFGVWADGPLVVSASGVEGVYLINSTDYINYPMSIDLPATIYPNATAARRITTHGDYTYVANETSMIILRHFKSAGATFIPGSYVAESTEIDTVVDDMIESATLTVDDYVPTTTTINYFMSADGGLHWEAVTLGVEYTFLHPGEDLRWKAEITGPEHCSAYIYTVEINFEFTEGLSLMWIAIIAGAGGLLLIIIATVVIAVVVKKKKATPTR